MLLAIAGGLALPVAAEEAAAPRSHLVRLVAGLRQTLWDSGAAGVADRVTRWTDRLAVGGIGTTLRSSMGLATATAGTRSSVPHRTISIALSDEGSGSRNAGGITGALRGLSLGIGPNYDTTWALGHAHPSAGAATSGQPMPALALSGNADVNQRTGRGVAEQALAGHEINLGIPVPYLSWAQLSAGRYWWGSQDFVPEVRGSRAGLKLNPLPFVEIEGGRMQDSVRGAGAYVSARITIPLDSAR